MNQKILLEITKIISAQNKRPVKISKNLLQKDKKQVYRKYKHRWEYSNTDGSAISNKKEFRDAQIRLVRNSNTVCFQ
jgi:hypothetical protein